MIPKHRIISLIIRQLGGTDYLEIGIAEGFNINAVKCERKVGVDPMTEAGTPRLGPGVEFHSMDSDLFFKQKPKEDRFDVIFIDGLHHAEQVERDIVNAWYSLKPNGVMILHDVNPPTEAHQVVPRSQLSWTGDVWKAFCGFRATYDKIPSGYIPERYGLGWIKKVPRTKVEPGFIVDATYQDLQKNLGDWLGFDKLYNL